jgi:hypothetical protein
MEWAGRRTVASEYGMVDSRLMAPRRDAGHACGWMPAKEGANTTRLARKLRTVGACFGWAVSGTEGRVS